MRWVARPAEPGSADIREKADADFRHGELEAVAGNPVRAMHRHPDAAAHHQSVDQRDIGLAKILDRNIERIFVAPELQRLAVPPGLAEIVERANVAAGREGALAGSLDHHAGNRRIVSPAIELGAQRKHHGVGDGVERLRPVERDETGRAATFEENIVGHRGRFVCFSCGQTPAASSRCIA
jgi:hypothetical protein